MQLRAQVTELSTHLEGLERERDFYFAKVCRYVKLSFEYVTYAIFLDFKLRDIEILVQQQIEEDEAAEKDSGVLKEIQTILYSTEVGPSP